eukprot:GILJ01005512.1.p1 GENE.GILJ01005512.1~~GILJ01005512.1.p1  ORF type:complete len:283 (-),score=20.39 GILJ01005512.1:179-1027(-)
MKRAERISPEEEIVQLRSKVLQLNSEKESLAQRLLSSEQRVTALSNENFSLRNQLEKLQTRSLDQDVLEASPDDTFITAGAGVDSMLEICENCAKEVPRINLTSHLSFCFRNVGICPFCKAKLNIKELDAHILEHRGTLGDITSAVSSGDIVALDRMLSHGADINMTSGEHKDPLLLLACRYGVVSVVDFLLTKGVDVSSCNAWGESGLHLSAVRGGSPEVAQLLISRGIDTSLRTQLGDTALHIAQRSGNHSVLMILTSRAASAPTPTLTSSRTLSGKLSR